MNAAPQGYMPPSTSPVYRIWAIFREHATPEDFMEASTWWVDTGFAVAIPLTSVTSLPISEKAPVVSSLANPEVVREPASGGASWSESEIVNHFLNHTQPLTDLQTVLLMFRWFALETSEVAYQAGHFRAELERRKIALKNVDSTLGVLVTKGLITCITSVPKKTYSITPEGNSQVDSVLALCPDVEDPLIS